MALTIIFGGTFDPVHRGHIEAALEVSAIFDSSPISLMPCFLPVHKSPSSVTASNRLSMLELAIKDSPSLSIDSREIARAEPSYSVDSLKEIREERGESEVIVLVLGTDAAEKLSSWKGISEFPSLSHLLIMQRSGFERAVDYRYLKSIGFELAKDKNELNQKDSGLILEVTSSAPAVSSSEIRQKLSKKESVNDFLDGAVSTFICDNGLYL